MADSSREPKKVNKYCDKCEKITEHKSTGDVIWCGECGHKDIGN